MKAASTPPKPTAENDARELLAEEKKYLSSFQSLLMQTPVAIAIFRGSNYLVELANEMALGVMVKDRSFIGEPLFEAMPELEHPVKEVFDKIMQTGIPFQANEMELTLFRNGKTETGWFNVNFQPIQEDDTTISGILATANEVTEQVLAKNKNLETQAMHAKELEEKMQQGTKELNKANNLRQDKNDEKEKRAAELIIANKELAFQNEENGKVESPLLENESSFYNAVADPSEQKKVKNVLKESEEKFRLIFEKSLAPIMIADDKGNYLEVNKAAEEIFEYSNNELMGMNVGDLITTSNLDAVAQYEEYIKKGEEIGEFGFISKNGTPKIVQYQAVRIKPDYNLSILMDVTEQKQASQYARSLIEASLDPLVTISADGKITDVNEASIKVTGVEREKLIDTDFSNYFTEPKKAQEGYLQVFEKGFVADYPLTIKHKNGNLTDVLYNASVYKDDKGNVLGVFAAARDVTEQKWAKDLRIANKELAFQNEEKEKRAAELILANKELEAFTYVSSHDLQEPLRKIRTIAGRILEKENQNLSDSGKNYFHLLQNAAERMQTLIQDLLAFSHLSMADRNFETTDLNIIIEEVKKEFKDAIAEKNAVIEVKEIYDVKIIPFQFRQLMHNLISNALKYSNPKIPPHIKISSVNITYSKINDANVPPHKEYCHISISDNGIGFEKEFAEKIFQVFQKLHAKDEYAGTGIGLAIVKKIVENHNGVIFATSKLNIGTTFNIYIPA